MFSLCTVLKRNNKGFTELALLKLPFTVRVAFILISVPFRSFRFNICCRALFLFLLINDMPYFCGHSVKCTMFPSLELFLLRSDYDLYLLSNIIYTWYILRLLFPISYPFVMVYLLYLTINASPMSIRWRINNTKCQDPKSESAD